jgi:hypothetical protein
MSKFDIRKRFLKLAYDQLNPNITSLDGLEQALKNWYCFQYNVPPNDDKLLEMTLEELLILNQMHQLKDNPHLADEIGREADGYEEWLKKEMGENYISEDDMVKKTEMLEKEEKEFLQKNKEKFPDTVSTNFSNDE